MAARYHGAPFWSTPFCPSRTTFATDKIGQLRVLVEPEAVGKRALCSAALVRAAGRLPRMTARKPGVAFWTTVILVTVVFVIPVSFGPAVWLTAGGHFHKSTVERVYWPILWASVYGPDPVWRVTSCWGSLGVSPDDAIVLEVESETGARIQVPFGNSEKWSFITKSLKFKSRRASRARRGGTI